MEWTTNMDRQSDIGQNPDSTHICRSFIQEAYSLPDMQASGKHILIHDVACRFSTVVTVTTVKYSWEYLFLNQDSFRKVVSVMLSFRDKNYQILLTGVKLVSFCKLIGHLNCSVTGDLCALAHITIN